jgi:hypothetical protein
MSMNLLQVTVKTTMFKIVLKVKLSRSAYPRLALGNAPPTRMTANEGPFRESENGILLQR